MPLDTDFNVAPFFDDYDATKNYHRVLFRPAVPVQARELTQLQTMLQQQIERFGNNVYVEGTIIKGTSFTFDNKAQYVKINDLMVSGTPVDVTLLANTIAIDSANLQAQIMSTVVGLESQAPDLNTLYVKYLNTGTGGKQVYAANNILTVYDRDYRLQAINVVAGGTNYSNNDSLTFTGGGGSGAAAKVLTYANGTIQDVIWTSYGANYKTNPTVGITTSTGSGANLQSVNYKAQVTVGNTSVTPIGKGYIARVTEGVIYQKGNFIRVEPQETIVSKYTNLPNNVVLGFVTHEAIVNNSVDTTLLDNAQGYSNYNAPGAYRLQLTPELITLSTANAAANANFFSLIEFQNGRIVKDRTVTTFNSITDELARRTKEESGDYVVQVMPISTEAASNTTHINAVVGAGVAYVDGFRVQQNDSIRVGIRKATDTTTDEGQSISTNYGNYVLVNQYLGHFAFDLMDTVSLRDAAGTDVSDNYGGTATTPGNQIGTARIRSVMYDSGTPGTPECMYRLYLFDINMSAGKTFSLVRAVADAASQAVADVVLTGGKAVMQEASFDRMLFPVGTDAIKNLGQEQFIYRKATTTALSTSGTITVGPLSGEYFPYTTSSTLNDTQERDFVIIPVANTYSSTNKSGTVTVTAGANAVTGTSTAFTSDYRVGDYIKFGSIATYFRVSAINSDTSMNVANSVSGGVASNTHSLAFPKGVPIPTHTRTSANISIDSVGNTATVALGVNIATQVATVVYHNAKVVNAAPRAKTITKQVYVKISGAALAAKGNGPWSLGLPDVLRITAVYRGTGSTYATSGTNYAKHFLLDNGQRDNYYSLATFKRSPGSTLTLNSSYNLTVVCDVFVHQAGGYYLSTESYPVDDTTTPLPATKIRTQDVPVFVSPSSGAAFNLRDVIDFRPAVSNTAVYATAIGSATIDPSSTITFASTTRKFPTPNQVFEADVTSYQSRIDRIVIDSQGVLRNVEGVPSNKPRPPIEPNNTMTLALVNVPPYPTLSAKDAADAQRPEYGTYVEIQQHKGYTMLDIEGIEKRIQRLEYYSLLNALEKDAKDMQVATDADPTVNRFKNGFFADNFNGYTIADTRDPEFNFQIVPAQGVGRPPVKEKTIRLKVSSTTAQVGGDLATLTWSETPLMKQPIATRYHNLAEDYWHFFGHVDMVPPYDDYYDVDTTPVNVTIDLATPLTNLINAANQTFTPKSSKTVLSTSLVSNTLISTQTTAGGGGTTTTQTYEQQWQTTGSQTTSSLVAGGTNLSNQKVGDFVTNFALSPYIRAQSIKIRATGLRPGARHYVFFDKQPVSNRVTPATVSDKDKDGKLTVDEFIKKGKMGDAIYADADGVLTCDLSLQGNKFFCGEREVMVVDVDAYDSVSAATSRSIGTFVAYDFNVARSSVTLTTKSLTSVKSQDVTTNWTTTSRTTTQRSTFVADPVTGDGGGDGGGGCAPIAQTFKVPTFAGSDGVYISSVDVFMKRKDLVFGMWIEIRSVDNGYPGLTCIAKKRLASSAVKVSDTGNVATNFKFDELVYLRCGQEYALILHPEGFSPEYLAWSAEVGGADQTDSNLIHNRDWGHGAFFLSTNGTAWTASQAEDLKFTINRAKFQTASDTLTLANDDYEFLTINEREGSFQPGELVAQVGTSYPAGNVTCSNTTNVLVGTGTAFTTSYVVGDYLLLTYGMSPTTGTGTVTSSGTAVTGTSTLFQTEYAVGDYIRVNADIREITAIASNTALTIASAFRTAASSSAHYRVSPEYDVTKVVSIANNTSMTVSSYGRQSTNTTVFATHQRVVGATVDATATDNDDKITLIGSNAANSTFLFSAGAKIVGDASNARAKITSIDNIGVNYVEPSVRRVVPIGSTLTSKVTTRNTSGTTTTQDIVFGTSMPVPVSTVVKSKSNEISGTSILKSLTVNFTLDGVGDSISPIVDISPISCVVIENQVNNSSTNEYGQHGSALAKYISKRVVLADGMDAEDMKVYVTGYRPVGSQIKVYARLLNASDSDTFENKQWTELTLEGNADVYGSSLTENDFKEYTYGIPTSPAATVLSGVVSTTSGSTTVTGSGTSFTAQCPVGTLVKIVRSDDQTDYFTSYVSAVASDTSLTLAEQAPWTQTGQNLYKVSPAMTAFKNPTNSGILRYYDDYDKTAAYYDTYKTFAIKVVLLASNSKTVPLLRDIRAIAVSI